MWLCGLGLVGLGLGGFGSGSLETVEVCGGLMVGALDAGDEALEAEQDLRIVVEGVGELEVRGEIFGALEDGEEALPDFGFGFEEASEAPAVGNHLIDQDLLAGVGWMAGFGEIRGEGLEFFRVFAGDDLLDGMDAGLQ